MSESKHLETLEIHQIDEDPNGCLLIRRRIGRGMAFRMPFSRFIPCLEELKNQGETRTCTDKKCVYILFGVDNKYQQKIAYIGETSNCLHRFKTKHGIQKNQIRHDKIKEHKRDWTVQEAVIFCVNDASDLTKDHIYYVETELIKRATNGAYGIANVPAKQNPHISSAHKTEADYFIEGIILLSGALGYKIFEPLQISPSTQIEVQSDVSLKNVPTSTIFSYSRKDNEKVVFTATGQQTDGGFVILKDSQVNANTVTSCLPIYVNGRVTLIEQGVIKNNKFTRDYTFISPSFAASVIAGSTVNGQTAWKCQQDNKTIKLKDWKSERNSQSSVTE